MYITKQMLLDKVVKTALLTVTTTVIRTYEEEKVFKKKKQRKMPFHCIILMIYTVLY